MKKIISIIILITVGILSSQTPEQFEHNQSMNFASYFFYSVTINEISIESTDWVGAFYGDICIGAKQWDTSQCGGGICDVTIMGADGHEHSEGYIPNGEIPTFKIYDASEDAYYNADITTSSNLAFFALSFVNNITLNASTGCTNVNACNYDNTINTNNDDGSCLYNDCNGDCGGSSIEDECGICDGDNTSCLDCANVPNGNSVFDVCGECGGNCIDNGANIVCGENIGSTCEEALSIDELPAIPADYYIQSIYPNPFNPSTTISFSIPEFGLTTITALNIQGKKMETLISEFLTVGTYSITWDPSDFPSGIYIISMKINNFTQTQKVVFAK